MWDHEKRLRFRELRQTGRNLTTAEQAELQSLIQELEAAEATYLNTATERLHQENDKAEQQNTHLDRLIERKQALVQRLRSVLAETRAEQKAIEDELATVLAANSDPLGED